MANNNSGRDKNEKDLVCSFCGKHQDEVERMIIGPGGKNIKAITAATGASVDIEDSGRISIFAPTAESMEQAK